jgi:hypothetical protein
VENAFSREPGKPCRYVQDAMLDRADHLWSMLQDGAVVLVCGKRVDDRARSAGLAHADLPGPHVDVRGRRTGMAGRAAGG